MGPLMKKTLGTIFGIALIAIPAFSIARSYEAPFLSCQAQYPVVSVGNAGRFHAVSNVQGPFMWVAEDGDYGVYDAGPQFITPFTRLGIQQVDVVWGSKRATCLVEVVPMPGYGEPYSGPLAPAPIYADGFGGDLAPGFGPNVTLSSAFYPTMPNTGLEPQTFAALAFAVVLLMAAGIALYPHARKAFAIAVR